MEEIIIEKNFKLKRNREALIKSKWTCDSVKLQIFVRDLIKDLWSFYEGECTKEFISKQCNPIGIQYEQIKQYLTSSKNDEVYYEIEKDNKLIIYVKENFDSQDFADIIYLKVPLIHKTISKEAMDILLELIKDLDSSIKGISEKNQLIDKLNVNFANMLQRYEKLATEQESFRKNFYDKAIHLLNSKKKFIQENICNITKTNISLDVGPNDEAFENQREQNDQPSTSAHTPTRKYSNAVNKTPTRSAKRTPSKRLREIQEMTDSDDSFSVFSIDNVKKKRSDESLDPSRVFKNFKIKTPKKQDFNRESSVELKVEKEPLEHSSKLTSDSDREYTVEGVQNAQKLDITDTSNNEQNIQNDEQFEDEIPCSQEMVASDFSSSYHERRTLSKSSRSLRTKQRETQYSTVKDPYDADTVNILNFSD